jgi:hypothetical protein
MEFRIVQQFFQLDTFESKNFSLVLGVTFMLFFPVHAYNWLYHFVDSFMVFTLGCS